MQVAPIQPLLKAPITMRLTLNYDELLSNFALNFNLCRYNVAHAALRGGGPGSALANIACHVIQHVYFYFLFSITVIEPHGASHGELNRPSPQSHPTRFAVSFLELNGIL